MLEWSSSDEDDSDASSISSLEVFSYDSGSDFEAAFSNDNTLIDDWAQMLKVQRPNAKFLELSDNSLNHVPEFQESFTEIYLQYNALLYIPELPSQLVILNVYDNKLTYLPKLPDTLEDLNCGGNSLECLPELPPNLLILDCSNNKLSELPMLPETLKDLNFFSNPIKYAPEFPLELQFLRYDPHTIDGTPINILPISQSCKFEFISGTDNYFGINDNHTHYDATFTDLINEIKRFYSYRKKPLPN